MSLATEWAAKIEPLKDGEIKRLRRKAEVDVQKLKDLLLSNEESVGDSDFYKHYSQQKLEQIRKARSAAKD